MNYDVDEYVQQEETKNAGAVSRTNTYGMPKIPINVQQSGAAQYLSPEMNDGSNNNATSNTHDIGKAVLKKRDSSSRLSRNNNKS
jgi:hypothetical protein